LGTTRRFFPDASFHRSHHGRTGVEKEFLTAGWKDATDTFLGRLSIMLLPFNKLFQKPAAVRSTTDFSLRQLAAEVFEPLAAQCERQAIETTIDIPANLAIVANRKLIARALEHLFHRAMAAMPRGGTLTVTAIAGRSIVELEVADTGASLSDVARLHIFDPLAEEKSDAAVCFRPDDSRELAAVHQIADLHGGDVTAANCPEGGAAITLRLPRRKTLEAAA
jgi:signal transduction histidine kinase